MCRISILARSKISATSAVPGSTPRSRTMASAGALYLSQAERYSHGRHAMRDEGGG